MGPVGSGKSSSCCVEIVSRALRQEPWYDGVRRSRWAVIRNTYPELKSTTIKTWETWFPSNVAPIKWDTPISSTMIINDIGDGTSLELEVLFLALDKPSETGKLRSLELTGAWINEASEIPKEIFDMVTQRVGRYPSKIKGGPSWSGVVLDTNPPGTKHWIAVMEENSRKQARKDVRYWHIPMEENAHNLRPGYVEEAKVAYSKKPALYKRMVLGEYADAFDGDPVLWAFNEAHAYDGLPWPRGAYLIRGWDFGTSQAVVWSAYWEDNGDEYWWDLHEYFATGSDVERQCRAVWDITREVFPFYNDRAICSGVLDACDPAGNARTDKGRSLDVLATHNIFPKFSNKHRSLQLTLSAYNRLLEKKDRFGRLVYRICRRHAPLLYAASCGGYRYPQAGEHGYGSGEPGKGPDFGNFDHVADASRYAKVNFMRLLKVELDALASPVGKLAAKSAVNPPRSWR